MVDGDSPALPDRTLPLLWSVVRGHAVSSPPPSVAPEAWGFLRTPDDGAGHAPFRGPTRPALGLVSGGGSRAMALVTVRLWLVSVTLGCAAALLVGQSGRCVMIAHHKQEALERCGGPEACHCTDCSWWHWQ
jgi:hypothetical protein